MVKGKGAEKIKHFSMPENTRKAKNAGEFRVLLEKALGRRQDVLRGRVTTRLALETLLIPLSELATAAGSLTKRK